MTVKDKVVSMIEEKGNFRVYAASTFNTVNNAIKVHNTLPTVSAGFGRLLTAGILMAAREKTERCKITLQVKGDGPIGKMVVVSDNSVWVKGYVDNPQVEVPLNENGKLDVGSAVGTEGNLIVVKDLGLKEPYIGQVSLVNGEIGDDIASYLTLSEQVPSVVSLGVLVDVDNTAISSGGYILELLPEANPLVIDIIEDMVLRADSVSSLLAKKNDPVELLRSIFDGFELRKLDEKDIDNNCDCNKERFKAGIISLGVEEIDEIIADNNVCETVCHFCNTRYSFDIDELKAMRKDSQDKK